MSSLKSTSLSSSLPSSLRASAGAVSTMPSADSADDSQHVRRNASNFFSLVNVDCINLGLSGSDDAGVYAYGARSTDDVEYMSGLARSSSSAQGEEIATVLSHEVTCFICLQDFEGVGGKRPVQLTCGHSVCVACEDVLAGEVKTAGIKLFRCPVCSRMSQPPHHVNSTLIKQLADKDVQKQRRVCAECRIEKIEVFCEDCMIPLCAGCDDIVHAPKPFMKHKRNKTEVAPMGRQLLTKCRLHFEEITQYCAPCGEVLCASCVNAPDSVHREHDTQPIAAVVAAQRAELVRLSDESAQAEITIETTLRAVEEGLEKLTDAQKTKDVKMNSVKKTKADINAHFDGIIERLQSRRHELLDLVDVITDHKVMSLKAQQAALSHLLTRSYLASCRGRITTTSGGDVAVAGSYATLRQHLTDLLNTDMSSTSMREPVVDFHIPEFHGPAEIRLERISQYGAVGGPRIVTGLSCRITDVATSVRLKWDPVMSRGRHEARSIEVHMAIKGTSRALAARTPIVRSDSYELSSDDETDAAEANLIEYVHEYKLIGEAELDATEFIADVSSYQNQTLMFRVRVVDADMNLMGPWSAETAITTPKRFGKVLTYRSPFDQYGVMNFLGMLHGRSEWANPIISGALVVTASSFGEMMYARSSQHAAGGLIAGRAGWLTTPPKGASGAPYSSPRPVSVQQISMLASRTPPPVDWTCCTEDAPASWICLDIGAGRLLKISHYCIRNGAAVFQGSSASTVVSPSVDNNVESPVFRRSSSNLLNRSSSSFSSKLQDGSLPFALPSSGGAFDKCATLRSWHFQGRVREGGEWVTLSVHTRIDSDILTDIPHLSCGWPISSKLGAYRFFRILQTGRNSIGNDILSIAGIDLYGTIF